MAENKLDIIQHELEDALQMEITDEEIKNTEYGTALLKWLRKRRRKIEKIFRILRRIDNG